MSFMTTKGKPRAIRSLHLPEDFCQLFPSASTSANIQLPCQGVGRAANGAPGTPVPEMLKQRNLCWQIKSQITMVLGFLGLLMLLVLLSGLAMLPPGLHCTLRIEGMVVKVKLILFSQKYPPQNPRKYSVQGQQIWHFLLVPSLNKAM